MAGVGQWGILMTRKREMARKREKTLGNFKKFGMSPSGTSMPDSSKNTAFIMYVTHTACPHRIHTGFLLTLSSKPVPACFRPPPEWSGKAYLLQLPTHSTLPWETYFLPSWWSHLPTTHLRPVLTWEPCPVRILLPAQPARPPLPFLPFL